MTPILEFVAVSKRYGVKWVLRDFNLNINPGEIVALIGPNGSGKTTAINIAARVVDPEKGDLRLEGASLLGRSSSVLASLGISRVFQTSEIQPDLVVSDAIAAGAYFRLPLVAKLGLRSPQIELDSTASSVLDILGIASIRDFSTSTLTYAQRRYIEIARVVVSLPRLLLIDEPTAGLTDAERQPIVEALRLLREGGAGCLLVDHDLSLVSALADRCVFLNQGQIVASGPPESVMSSESFLRNYLGLVPACEPC